MPKQEYIPTKNAADAFAAPLSPADRATCLFFLDANVLLLPYTASSHSVKAILDLYAALRGEDRLFIPAQAAREYARNRATKIGEIYKVLGDRMSAELPARAEYPLLSRLPEYTQLTSADEKIKSAFKERRATLEALRRRVRAWSWSDPVRDEYARVLANAVVSLEMDPKELARLRDDRFTRKLPPGYKDAAKLDGGGGDLDIWFTIIQECAKRGRDAIFVTGEEKADWYQRSDSGPLFPRYELLDEFRSETGHSFEMVPLSELLRWFNAPADAVADVVRSERAGARRTDAGVAEELVLQYFRTLYPSAASLHHTTADVGFDILIRPRPNERIGVEVWHARAYDYRRADDREIRAIQVLRNSDLSELVLFVVSDQLHVANDYANRYAEQRIIAPRLRVIVGYAHDGQLDVLWPASAPA